MSDDKKSPIIVIVGYAGSGKSYLSNQYSNKGYFVISGDEIIRNHLVSKDNNTKHFGIYQEIVPKELMESKNEFISIVKNLICLHKKVVIEGQFRNVDMLKEIIGNNEFNIIINIPNNMKTYINHLTNRFIESPENYGRIGSMAILDNKKKGLNDYYENGIEGKIIRKLINNCAKAR
jgi:dephospho-CoA kinase